LYQKFWLFTYCSGWWNKLGSLLKPGDTVIYQHPLYGVRIAIDRIKKLKKEKGCRFIALIHDLPTLRGKLKGDKGAGRSTNDLGDITLLKLFDAVICHNDAMRKVLTDYGLDGERLIDLGIFDYLTEYACQGERRLECSISIAGNLDQRKSGYIYRMKNEGHNDGLEINLYGPNVSKESLNDKVIWNGSFEPSELPSRLKGSFGLVWDGSSAETCSGNMGEYLRYNNPHKTSLYLSAGLPVIIWKEAAMADFICQNKAGFTVSSLYEVEDAIRDLSEEDYSEMCRNAAMISERLREGYYFTTALDKAMSTIINE